MCLSKEFELILFSTTKLKCTVILNSKLCLVSILFFFFFTHVYLRIIALSWKQKIIGFLLWSKLFFLFFNKTTTAKILMIVAIASTTIFIIIINCVIIAKHYNGRNSKVSNCIMEIKLLLDIIRHVIYAHTQRIVFLTRT